MKKCNFCAEEIQEEAIKCKHCGEMLNQQAPSVNKRFDCLFKNAKGKSDRGWIEASSEISAKEFLTSNGCQLVEIVSEEVKKEGNGKLNYRAEYSPEARQIAQGIKKVERDNILYKAMGFIALFPAVILGIILGNFFGGTVGLLVGFLTWMIICMASAANYWKE